MREHSAAAPYVRSDGLPLTPELLDEFLDSLRRKGRTPETLLTYRRNLNLLYDSLSEEKAIHPGTLEAWRRELLAVGYAPRTINLCISAASSLLEYCGRRELQVQEPLKPEQTVQPELSRGEYLRLLSTARALGWERIYLLVKVFGSTGLMIQELPQLTAEAVRNGEVHLSGDVLHIPKCLRQELLSYISRAGILSGPLFVTRSGTPS